MKTEECLQIGGVLPSRTVTKSVFSTHCSPAAPKEECICVEKLASFQTLKTSKQYVLQISCC